MKSVILYYSVHHGNTKKLVKGIAQEYDIQLVDILETKSLDLSAYDLIGFASGIYAFNLPVEILKFAQENLPESKRVFCLYTCAMLKSGYTKKLVEIVKNKNCEYVGEFGCNGYNTFGPFKIVGGTSKGHPDEVDIRNAIKFYTSVKK